MDQVRCLGLGPACFLPHVPQQTWRQVKVRREKNGEHIDAHMPTIAPGAERHLNASLICATSKRLTDVPPLGIECHASHDVLPDLAIITAGCTITRNGPNTRTEKMKSTSTENLFSIKKTAQIPDLLVPAEVILSPEEITKLHARRSRRFADTLYKTQRFLRALAGGEPNSLRRCAIHSYADTLAHVLAADPKYADLVAVDITNRVDVVDDRPTEKIVPPLPSDASAEPEVTGEINALMHRPADDDDADEVFGVAV